MARVWPIVDPLYHVIKAVLQLWGSFHKQCHVGVCVHSHPVSINASLYCVRALSTCTCVYPYSLSSAQSACCSAWPSGPEGNEKCQFLAYTHDPPFFVPNTIPGATLKIWRQVACLVPPRFSPAQGRRFSYPCVCVPVPNLPAVVHGCLLCLKLSLGILEPLWKFGDSRPSRSQVICKQTNIRRPPLIKTRLDGPV